MKTLVTGSTGYIGSRLIAGLLEAGHDVVAGMRDVGRAAGFSWAPQVQARHVDLNEPATLSAAMAGVDVAYFVVHSMDSPGFAARDAAGARAFAAACDEQHVGQLVYLSGLIPSGVELSDHLASRLEVERIFLHADTPATVHRAAMIIGAGSTSFELVRRLVQRLPVLPIPRWMNNRVQPIATDDVVAALVAAATGPAGNGHHDLGGPDQLTYPQLLAVLADELHVHRRHIPVPALAPSVVGRIVAAVTAIPTNTTIELLASLGHDMICHDDPLSNTRLSVRDAISRSLNPTHTGTTIGGDHQTADPADPT